MTATTTGSGATYTIRSDGRCIPSGRWCDYLRLLAELALHEDITLDAFNDELDMRSQAILDSGDVAAKEILGLLFLPCAESHLQNDAERMDRLRQIVVETYYGS